MNEDREKEEIKLQTHTITKHPHSLKKIFFLLKNKIAKQMINKYKHKSRVEVYSFKLEREF